jgi:hypothetical protein
MRFEVYQSEFLFWQYVIIFSWLKNIHVRPATDRRKAISAITVGKKWKNVMLNILAASNTVSINVPIVKKPKMNALVNAILAGKPLLAAGFLLEDFVKKTYG